MCGFVGIYDRRHRSPAVSLEPLLQMMRHRGPDDTGTYVDARGQMSLGFVRLSIIDLRSGRQPVYNENSNVTCVLNGEIYNYLELREDLCRRGHSFRSQGDAETIVHLYEEFGEGFVSHLEGMFAIAIWDERQEKLVVARDHFGIKPLYFTKQDGRYLFASEIKPLLALGFGGDGVDDEALVQYLSYGYVLNPRTIFRGICKLEPGSVMVIGAHGDTTRRYWDLSSVSPCGLSGDELRASVLDAFDRSIRLHLRSDVPVGAFLSGGIDSGLLVARAAGHHPRLKTYTLSFSGNPFDEAPLAALVAERYGTDHTVFTVSPDSLLDSLVDMVWMCDEPLADSGLLPNYLINKLAAADGVKVVLNGAGGDELFAGYSYYFPSPIERRLRRFPPLAALLAAAAAPFSPEARRKFIRASYCDRNPLNHYLGHTTVWPLPEVARLLHAPVCSDADRAAHFRAFTGDTLNAKLYADIRTYLTDDLMLLLDRTSMAHSIEGRVPYLNHRLAELALGIPAESKAPDGDRKRLLKEIARPHLPVSLIDQPKMGFNSPVSVWLGGDLGIIAERLLTSETCLSRPIWNPDELRRFVSDPSSRRRFSHRFFTLFMLEVYLRVHYDSRSAAPPGIPLRDLR